MLVKDLKDNMPVDEIRLEITKIRESKTVSDGNKLQNFLGIDESGEEVDGILWNDECDKFHQGDNVIIHSGFAKTFNGKLQVSPSKYGTIKLI